MSKGQPQRHRTDQFPEREWEREPIKYGDVFDVFGELASKPIAAKDAAAMQTAENMVLGHTPWGGPASVMESAAEVNEQMEKVSHRDATSLGRDQGLTVSDRIGDGDRIFREATRGQVVGQFSEPLVSKRTPADAVCDVDAITIGQALEATALSVPNKPVDQGDAAAIRAAEAKATGNNQTLPGGLGAMAQSAAAFNARLSADAYKTTISDVIGDATDLPVDKTVTREDADSVISAEVRNKADRSTTPGGVAASMAAAAGLNDNIYACDAT